MNILCIRDKSDRTRLGIVQCRYIFGLYEKDIYTVFECKIISNNIVFESSIIIFDIERTLTVNVWFKNRNVCEINYLPLDGSGD